MRVADEATGTVGSFVGLFVGSSVIVPTTTGALVVGLIVGCVVGATEGKGRRPVGNCVGFRLGDKDGREVVGLEPTLYP